MTEQIEELTAEIADLRAAAGARGSRRRRCDRGAGADHRARPAGAGRGRAAGRASSNSGSRRPDRGVPGGVSSFGGCRSWTRRSATRCCPAASGCGRGCAWPRRGRRGPTRATRCPRPRRWRWCTRSRSSTTTCRRSTTTTSGAGGRPATSAFGEARRGAGRRRAAERRAAAGRRAARRPAEVRLAVTRRAGPRRGGHDRRPVPGRDRRRPARRAGADPHPPAQDRRADRGVGGLRRAGRRRAEPAAVSRACGAELGLLFQIVDDILDEGSDGEPSYVNTLGMERAASAGRARPHARARALLAELAGRHGRAGRAWPSWSPLRTA